MALADDLLFLDWYHAIRSAMARVKYKDFNDADIKKYLNTTIMMVNTLELLVLVCVFNFQAYRLFLSLHRPIFGQSQLLWGSLPSDRRSSWG